jgi:thymidylate synthase (FAD)
MKISAKLVALTQPVIGTPAANSEALIAYCARVSNPNNQDNPDYSKLLDYCIRNKHWSVFEMANAIVEVEAPRDITRQLLRHRSFCFQEFSQRYSDEIEFTSREFRRQDDKNRQNSVDDLDETLQDRFDYNADALASEARMLYTNMRKHSVAKECARVILPEGLTMSKLYVNGTVRSWLHYLDVRDDPGVTQWEHVLLAREIRKALEPAFPTIFKVNNELSK